MKHWLAALLAGLIVLTGCGAVPSTTEVGSAPAASQASGPMAKPTAVEIPSLGVTSSLLPVGQDETGAADADFPALQAAWYQYSVKPGEVGPMVLYGHVDGDGQAGIFNRLREVGIGESVLVASEGGMVYEYEITNTEQHPKDEFPTDLVYGDTDAPTIRLITCGGPFGTDRAGHYDDNVIAFGVLVGSYYPE